MKKPRRPLSKEEQKLWERVTRTIKPSIGSTVGASDDFSRLLDGKSTSQPLASKPAPSGSQSKKPGSPPSAPQLEVKSLSEPRQRIPEPIDARTLRDLQKGRRSIDARIDLHGLTHDRAKQSLEGFLDLSFAAGHRMVLVITGKGPSGMGVLKQSVPVWLDQPTFRRVVNGYRIAHPRHGGEGALYVRIRRRQASRS